VTSLTLTGPSGAVALPWDAASLAFTGALAASDYTAWSSYALEPLVGGDLPEAPVDDFVLTAGPLALTSPVLDGTQPPLLSENQLAFTWSASGADVILFELMMVNSSTGTVDDYVSCVASDDGAFTIPAGTFATWNTNDYIQVYVGRVREASGTFAHDNGESRVSGIWYSVGAILPR
jgi:hypothetical protein